MATTDEKVGRQIQRLREAAGMSKTQLAALLSEAGQPQFHPTTITRVESGERSIRVAEALHIANALGVRFETLLPVDSVDSLVRGAQVQSRMIEGQLRSLSDDAEEILFAQHSLRDLLQRITPKDIQELAPDDYGRGRLRAQIYGAQEAAEADIVKVVKDAVEQWRETYGEDDGVDQEA